MSGVYVLTPSQRSEVAALKATLEAADQTAKTTAWTNLQTYLLSLVDAAPKSSAHLASGDLAIIYKKKDE